MGQGYTSTVWVAKLLLRLVIVGGQVAQLVEQRTENPCVVGSIPTLAMRGECHKRRSAKAGRLLRVEGQVEGPPGLAPALDRP